ncbi:MAG: antitoxin Xre/MbcA/ParS toxin-binding domain-containing protein [Sphingomonadales bacterium]
MSDSDYGFSERPVDRLGFIDQIRTGLSFETVAGTARALGLTVNDLAAFGVIPLRTLSHSRRGGQFSPAQSDRVARFFRIWRRTLDTFGGPDRARRWLERPTRPLGGAAPMSLLDTEEGARFVEDVLSRIDHGLAA